MLTKPPASWYSSEENDKERDLVDVLESYTRELGALCGGLEVQQLEAEDDDRDEDIGDGSDTLASLEEINGECAALLACLEAAGRGSDEVDDGDDEVLKALNIDVSDGPDPEGEDNHRSQEDELDAAPHREELAHELDSFADELNLFLSSLGDHDIEVRIVDTKASPSGENATRDLDEEEKTQIDHDFGKNPPATPDATANTENSGNDAPANADEAHLPHPKDVFSERTKKAIALHVKRLALQKQRRRRNGFTISNTKDPEAGTGQERIAGVPVAWSRFQSTSFQQHIMRQNFARRRVKQIQETQRLVESARLRGATGASIHRPAKSDSGKSSSQTAQHASYLDHFKATSTHSLAANEFEPRYLCAVYLYGRRRLGTTFITFSSLAQFEQRVRARFAIEEVVGIYREVTEAVPEHTVNHTSRRRHLKRLHRISSLEHVNDGDTLCVTQNAYDDMTILCNWIKRRQRVVHGFAYQVQQASTSVSALTNEESTPPKPKPSGILATKTQLWDANGRSIGVKEQHGI